MQKLSGKPRMRMERRGHLIQWTCTSPSDIGMCVGRAGTMKMAYLDWQQRMHYPTDWWVKYPPYSTDLTHEEVQGTRRKDVSPWVRLANRFIWRKKP